MWNLTDLKRELKARQQVKAWIVTQEHTHRRERYFMRDSQALALDQDRDVSTQSIESRVIVRLPNKPARQGEIVKKLFTAMPLGPQLDSAIEAALQTDHQAWDLPAVVESPQQALQTTDPRMAEDLEGAVSKLTHQIQACVAKRRETEFNSAELFLSVHDRELHLSNGLTHRSSQSRVYAETAYSYTKDGRSDEYLNTRWAVSLDDLPVERLFDETSDRAARSLDTVKPATGQYSVLVDAEVLAKLLGDHVSQLTSSNAYHALPYIAPDKELVPGASADLLTMTLDPTLSFGADTTAVSEQGVLQRPLKLVERNRVLTAATDKRYGDYLGLQATTSRGSLVVDPGTLSHAELTKAAPLVLEILQFSALFGDPNGGTFGSEIRLARLHDNAQGTVTYVKGGSLSGSINACFKHVRLSRERVKHATFSSNSSVGEGYYGPEYALLSDVSVVS